MLSWIEQKLIYVPVIAGPDSYKGLDEGFEEVWFNSADGTRLHGWYLEHSEPRATILYLHGNGGNIGLRSGVIRQLSEEQRVSVFLFDYRGYGRSEGSPHEAGVLQDARAARAWLAERAGLSESQLVLYGNSLGGGVAVDLALDGARGLVLLQTFTSLPDVASGRMPFLPMRWLMRHRLESIKKLPHYHGPVLIAHGDIDRVIPFRHGQRLYQAANEPKEFVRLPNHDHVTPLPSQFYKALDAFLERLP